MIPHVSIAAAEKSLALAGSLSRLPHPHGAASPVTEGIRVVGAGSVAMPPDLATLLLSVVARATTAGEAFTRLTVRTAALITLLAERGVAGADVETRALTLLDSSSAAPLLGAPASPPGRVARHDLAVRLRDVAGAGDLLAAVVSLLGDDAEIRGLVFDVIDRTELVERARAAAIGDAHAQAATMAALLGVEVGEAVLAQERAGEVPERPTGGPGTVSGPAGASWLQVPREHVVDVQVEVVYAIKHPHQFPLRPPSRRGKKGPAGE